MLKTCPQCQNVFEISVEDFAFYEKISPVFQNKKYTIPTPSLCPDCRRQRRMMFRNERHLYHRKCDRTGKQIISMHRPDVPFPVYSQEVWFSDEYDGREFGRDFDFNRPFFEQFKDLRDRVPHLSLISSNNENSDFCNVVGNSQNCYLIFGSINCENCYYGSPFNCKDTSDTLLLRNSELCIECMDSTNLYNCYFCQNCSYCQNLRFCLNVQNSSDCFACIGLNHRKYCILNEQYSEDAYKKIVSEFEKKGLGAINEILKKLEELKLKVPHRSYIGTNNQNVSGDYIWNTKNAHNVYNIAQCEDVKFGSQLLQTRDSMDIDYGEIGELLYDFMGFFNNVSRSAFCYWCWDNIHDLLYCANCTQGVQNCFGCVSLKRSQYCILNKQYTKEEYETLVSRIIEHMRHTEQWGEFFRSDMSPFYYNETVANEYFPITKEEAIKRKWRWQEEEKGKEYQWPQIELPVSIFETSDDITKHILKCEVTEKPYKIIPQELKLLRTLTCPPPRICPDQRHLNRLKKRNPRRLFQRNCEKCKKKVETTFAMSRREIIYCEDCYAKELY